jgi:hypothetical protein
VLVLVILYSWLSGMQEHTLLHTRQSAIQNNKYQSWSCSKAFYKPVWHIPLLSVQWISSWLWTDELSETCRVSWQNKFVKLVHLVGFITKENSCNQFTVSLSVFSDFFFRWYLFLLLLHFCYCIQCYCYSNWLWEQFCYFYLNMLYTCSLK